MLLYFVYDFIFALLNCQKHVWRVITIRVNKECDKISKAVMFEEVSISEINCGMHINCEYLKEGKHPITFFIIVRLAIN